MRFCVCVHASGVFACDCVGVRSSGSISVNMSGISSSCTWCTAIHLGELVFLMAVFECQAGKILEFTPAHPISRPNISGGRSERVGMA